MKCPSCGYDNIEGEDRCENCMKSLRDLDVPRADATGGLVRSVMEHTLGQLEKEEALTARADEPALDVVRRMNGERCSCVLVFEGERLDGIFTERDAWQKLSEADGANGDVKIGDVMVRRPETLRETDTIAAALSRMSIGRYRHVPVMTTSDGEYRIVSIRHVLKYIAQADW